MPKLDIATRQGRGPVRGSARCSARGPAWRSLPLTEEQRAGFSRDDLERYGMHFAATPRADILWSRLPIARMPEAMRELLAPDEAAGGDAAPELGPEDTVGDWSARAAAPPLRGSFRDFRAALRARLTGIAADAPAEEGLPQPILIDKVGAEIAAAFRRGEIGSEALQYHARSAAGLGAYCFGESLLAALGYYRRPRRHRQGGQAAATPFASGHFTGLRGVWAAEDLLPAAVQERLLLEALAWHLQTIRLHLPHHLSLDDLLALPLGGDGDGDDHGQAEAAGAASCATLSGLLAAAHLHDAEAAAAALTRKADAPRDRAVRAVMRQFGGYATPLEAPHRPEPEAVEWVLGRIRAVVDPAVRDDREGSQACRNSG